MQIYVPYRNPLDVAKCLDKRRLASQIREARLVLGGINGENGWTKGPLYHMYKHHKDWLELYILILETWRTQVLDNLQNMVEKSMELVPWFLTDEFCEHHKRRLYSHAPEKYPQFSHLGFSDENWYWENNKIIKFKNGKRI